MFILFQLTVLSTNFAFKTAKNVPNLRGSNWQPGIAMDSKIVQDGDITKMVLKVKKGPNTSISSIMDYKLWVGDTVNEAISLDNTDSKSSNHSIKNIILNKTDIEKFNIIQKYIINNLKVKNNVMLYDDIDIKDLYTQIKNLNLSNELLDSFEEWDEQKIHMRKPNALGLNKTFPTEKIDKILYLMKYLEVKNIEIDMSKLNISDDKKPHVLELHYNTFPFFQTYQIAHTPAFLFDGKTYKFIDNTTFTETIWFKILIGSILIGLLLLSILLGGNKNNSKK